MSALKQDSATSPKDASQKSRLTMLRENANKKQGRPYEEGTVVCVVFSWITDLDRETAKLPEAAKMPADAPTGALEAEVVVLINQLNSISFKN